MFEEKEAEAVLLGTRVQGDAAQKFGCKLIPASPRVRVQ